MRAKIGALDFESAHYSVRARKQIKLVFDLLLHSESLKKVCRVNRVAVSVDITDAAKELIFTDKVSRGWTNWERDDQLVIEMIIVWTSKSELLVQERSWMKWVVLCPRPVFELKGYCLALCNELFCVKGQQDVVDDCVKRFPIKKRS